MIQENIELRSTRVEPNFNFENIIVEPLTSPESVMEATKLEELAFKGDGEDIYTLSTIAKIGWLWGVRDNGTLVGAIELIRQVEPNKGFIHGVVVHPDRQYKGLGTKLVKHIEQASLEIGISKIECTIASDNGASLYTFLNHCGYEANKFISDCYGNGGHRLWVTRDLTKPIIPFSYQAISNFPDNSKGFIFEDDYGTLDRVINNEGWKVIGVVRPTESGEKKNMLCLVNPKS